MEGGVRRLTLKNCQVDQAGEVSYQALNAVTNAMLYVKGKTNPGIVHSFRIEITVYHDFRT